MYRGFLREKLNPEDYSWFLTFGKIRHDMRYRKKSGEYARILYQGLIIEHDNEGRLLRSLGVNSDITYLKEDGKPILSFIGMDDEPSFIDVGSENTFDERWEKFTKREKQVLALLIDGKLSKEISSILNISKQTVDTHRKNMIHKKNLSNTSELTGKAIKYGWI
jgi:DNA-binding CsgD family transcriptional regulator